MENRIKSTFRLSKEALEALDGKRKDLGLSQNAALEVLLLSGGKLADQPPADLTSENGSNSSVEAVEGWVASIGANWGSLMALEDKKASVLKMLEERANTEERLSLEHQKHLSEVMLTAEKATEDLKTLSQSLEIGKLRSELDTFSRSLGCLRVEQGMILSSAVENIATQTREHLLEASSTMGRARVQVEAFESKYRFHQEEISSVVSRVQKGLKLTPTVALSIVLVGCCLAVLTSVFFVPTFEKFQSDVLIQQTITPVLRGEIHTAFAKLREENQTSLKSFYDLEQDRFEKFAQKYRGQIEVLSHEKLALQSELQRVKQIAKSNSSYAAELKKENKQLNSKSGCGVISNAQFGSQDASEKGSKVGFTLLVSPLLFGIFAVLKSRKWEILTARRIS